MTHRCSVCTGYSPFWDLHDANPPCEGHENWLLAASFYDKETRTFNIPADLDYESRVRIGKALGDRANFRRGLDGLEPV